MKYKVTASSLNVRQEPSVESEALGVLRKNAIVDVSGQSPDGYWRKITYKTKPAWVSGKYLSPLANDGDIQKEEFKWMPIALREVGVKEVAGKGANPRIVQYLKSTTLPAPANATDETAWCSCFVNWCLEQAGFAGTDSAWARSWATWGKKLDVPRRGCIAVFKRSCQEGGPKNCGHVAFFIEESGTKIKVLGGNQGNAVSIREYPKADVIGYRVAG